MTKHAFRTGLGALALAAALTLAGCSSDTAGTNDSGGMGGMDHGSSTPAAAPSGTAPSSAAPSSAAQTPAAGPHNDADITFANGMVPHHQQAVEMSDMLLAKSDANAKVRDLAEQIKAAQAPEIAQMSGWLKGWGVEPTPMEPGMDHSGHGGADMGGMMSDADMKKLEAASGTDASRLYLEGMTKHHEGAVDMAKAEVSDGENPEAIELAKKIITTQQGEIATMKDLLATL